ncbi:hypothetical protein HY624_03815 [Candidatus Uhrbacteria bacterium]|nr:hypothetical protein [Candidatus Uhrbacteria bacterium]
MLLLSLFLFIGLVWSTLVLRGLKIVEKTDEAVVAFAAAESGVEDGLFRLKNKELPKDITGQSGTLANGSSWQRNVYNAVTIKTIDALNPGIPVIVDLYNPDVDPLTATLKDLAFGAASLTLVWDSGTTTSVTAEIMEWNGNTLVPLLAPVLGGTGGTIDGLDKAKSYRLTLSTTQPIKNIRVTATDKSGGAGNPQLIPEALSIESNGFYQSATQAIRMRLPRVAPW